MMVPCERSKKSFMFLGSSVINLLHTTERVSRVKYILNKLHLKRCVMTLTLMDSDKASQEMPDTIIGFFALPSTWQDQQIEDETPDSTHVTRRSRPNHACSHETVFPICYFETIQIGSIGKFKFSSHTLSKRSVHWNNFLTSL